MCTFCMAPWLEGCGLFSQKDVSVLRRSCQALRNQVSVRGYSNSLHDRNYETLDLSSFEAWVPLLSLAWLWPYKKGDLREYAWQKILPAEYTADLAPPLTTEPSSSWWSQCVEHNGMKPSCLSRSYLSCPLLTDDHFLRLP